MMHEKDPVSWLYCLHVAFFPLSNPILNELLKWKATSQSNCCGFTIKNTLRSYIWICSPLFHFSLFDLWNWWKRSYVMFESSCFVKTWIHVIFPFHSIFFPKYVSYFPALLTEKISAALRPWGTVVQAHTCKSATNQYAKSPQLDAKWHDNILKQGCVQNATAFMHMDIPRYRFLRV